MIHDLPTLTRDVPRLLRRSGVTAALYGTPWRHGAWQEGSEAVCVHVTTKLPASQVSARRMLRPYGPYALDVLEVGELSASAGLLSAPGPGPRPRNSTVTAAFPAANGRQHLLLSGHGALAWRGDRIERRFEHPVAVDCDGLTGITDGGVLDGQEDWATASFPGQPFEPGHPLAGPPPLVRWSPDQVNLGDRVRLQSVVRGVTREAVVRQLGGEADVRLPDGQILRYRGVLFVSPTDAEPFSVARDSGALVLGVGPTPRVLGTIVAATSALQPPFGSYVLPFRRPVPGTTLAALLVE